MGEAGPDRAGFISPLNHRENLLLLSRLTRLEKLNVTPVTRFRAR
jgi:hypothetical protein